MNQNDMGDRGIDDFDLIDMKSFSRDGTDRTVGYMPELNVLRGIADVSGQGQQPLRSTSSSR